MVVKCCPECKKTLAVACKTCPGCGYIFQARKVGTIKSEKGLMLDSKQRSERNKKDASYGNEYVYHGHRDENNQLYSVEINGYESSIGNYHGSNDIALNMMQKSMPILPLKKDDVKNTSSIIPIDNPPIKKRGRPKGSKDKQKRLPKGYKQLKLVRSLESSSEVEWEIRDKNMFEQNKCQLADANMNQETHLYRKRGRPRSSKDKPIPMFYAEDDDDDFDSDERDEQYLNIQEGFSIPTEKKEKYALILEDINQRIATQAFKA